MGVDRNNHWIGTPPHRKVSDDETRPVCEAAVTIVGSHVIRWRKERYGTRWRFCTFPARCRIEGMNYCARHGGEVALRKLLGDDMEGNDG